MAIAVEPGLHVVLGTGQTGRQVAEVLLENGADLRVVNRSGTVPGSIEGDVDAVAADVSDPEAAHTACDGASVVYFCLQPPYHRWPELFPPLLEGALAGAEAADATFVMADNLYMYGPVDGPIREDRPHDAEGAKGRVRAEMAETVLAAHEEGRVEATIGRASDFYGPGVTDSLLGERVFPAVLEGKTVWYPGNPDVPHTFTYVRDFAKALVVLGSSEAALGGAWHVPSAETRSVRDLVARAGEIAGTEPTVRQIPGWLLRIAGVVVRPIGELAEIRYQHTEPFEVSHETFASQFDHDPTPHGAALERTLEWYGRSH